MRDHRWVYPQILRPWGVTYAHITTIYVYSMTVLQLSISLEFSIHISFWEFQGMLFYWQSSMSSTLSCFQDHCFERSTVFRRWALASGSRSLGKGIWRLYPPLVWPVFSYSCLPTYEQTSVSYSCCHRRPERPLASCLSPPRWTKFSLKPLCHYVEKSCCM